MTQPLIVLAAGGTGGHVMPAAALAHDLLARGVSVHLMTDKRGMAYAGSFAPQVNITHIQATAPVGSILKKATAVSLLALGAAQSLWRLRTLAPAAVVGFGGYPSLPPVFAAQCLGIPTLIHEQNAVIGRANAALAKKAARIALSWPVPATLPENQAMRCVITGNPVRAQIAALSVVPYPAPEVGGVLRILVLGGSLGARIFSEVVPQALDLLPPEIRKRLVIVQQCRAEEKDSTHAAYAAKGITATLAPFFADVAGEIAKAQLLIARSGASMVAEVLAAGRPAIFVPYPHHKDGQQEHNARTVEKVGGAWVMPQEGFTPAALSLRIETFLQAPDILFQAANRAHSIGRPDAARRLGDVVMDVARGFRHI